MEKINGKLWNAKIYEIYSGIKSEFKDGKGYIKKYDDLGDIKFEGEYLNGEKNGKGKEYYQNNILKFEGEYLNGKRTGKGKEYYENGNLKFEGEYLNGKKNGKGKEYHENNINDKRIIIFEGEYLDGKEWNGKGYEIDFNSPENNKEYEIKNGKGLFIKYEDESLKFIGEYSNGEKNGKGKEYKDDNLIYEGEYLSGKRNGKGKEYGLYIYEGEFLNGEKNGKFKVYNNIGSLKFEGEFLYDQKLKGKEYINNKVEYEGDYLYDKKYNGKGFDEKGNIIYTLNNGNGKYREYHEDYDSNSNSFGQLSFEGECLNGIKKGKKYNDEGKLTFEGEIMNNIEWNGILYEYEYGNGNLSFKGELKNGKKEGKGQKYFQNNLIFNGEFFDDKMWNGKAIIFGLGKVLEVEIKNGEINGKGKEYIKNKIKFEGEYVKGERNGKGKEYLYKEPVKLKNNNGKLEEVEEEGKNNECELIFEGEYLDGKRYNGKGKEYDSSGELMFEGEYINGEKKDILNNKK